MALWSLDQIPWDQFDPGKVDPELLKLVKAAAIVEANGADYALYLARVFPDDPEFRAVAENWADEEVQHGAALAHWARLADPTFDFATAFRRFTDGYRIPLNVDASVRGSRAGELVARCVVEVGTSSYYTALMEGTEEPVLKAICRKIAADEFRHYKMFYTHLHLYLPLERLSVWGRVRVAFGRMVESEDDELAYAYYAANFPGEIYNRVRFTAAYARRAYSYYRRHHIERGIGMVLMAVGLRPTGRLNALLSGLAWRFMARRQRRLAAQGA
jgi:rubrerythrin